MKPHEFTCKDCNVDVVSFVKPETDLCVVCTWIRSLPEEQREPVRALLVAREAKRLADAQGDWMADRLGLPRRPRPMP